jgi:CubicO group peptidase (beta-lactamase class C family)
MGSLQDRPCLNRYAASWTLLTCVTLASAAFAFSYRPMAQASSSLAASVLPQVAAKYKIPGLAVAVITHGQLQGIDVFGVRDKDSNAPVTDRTVFEAGPLGEPLYAYAVLRLAAEGHYNPGAPIPALFPLPYVRDFDPTSNAVSTESLYDPQFNQVTAIRIMNHTSGMPDWSQNQHLRLQSAPGQKWVYSNEGYLYLQHAIEHITGDTFLEFLARSALVPARMAQSSFIWREEYAKSMATGYDRSGAPVEIHRYLRPAAAATLHTTVREYTQFITMLLASAPAQSAHESAVSLMLAPTVTVGNDSRLSWGLGFGLEKSGDDLFFFHRENGAGFQAFVIASRKSGSGVVIFTNSGNGLDAVPEILAATIGGDHPILKSAFLHSQSF